MGFRRYGKRSDAALCGLAITLAKRNVKLPDTYTICVDTWDMNVATRHFTSKRAAMAWQKRYL